VVRTRPEDLGLLPDGDSPTSQRSLAARPGEPPEPRGLSLSEAIRTSAFWVLSLGQIFWSFGSMSIIGHLAAFLSDAGFETRVAAGALGVTILVSVVGRVSFGFFSDRYQKRLIMSAALILHALAVACLFVEHTIAALAAFIIVFGMGLGGGSVVIPLLVGEYFGLRAFGTILGLVTISGTLGAAIGPVLTGRIFDVMGSYDLAFMLHIVSFFAAAVAMFLLRRPGCLVARDERLS
jgi:MFS family permease